MQEPPPKRVDLKAKVRHEVDVHSGDLDHC